MKPYCTLKLSDCNRYVYARYIGSMSLDVARLAKVARVAMPFALSPFKPAIAPNNACQVRFK